MDYFGRFVSIVSILILVTACGNSPPSGGTQPPVGTQPSPTSSYTVGGSVTGLSGTGLVLQNNAGDNLNIGANGSFTFPTAIADGRAYSVSVLTQPGSPAQSCSISNASGTISGSNVTDVVVSCTTLQSYTINGNVTGLSGTGLVLQDNSGDNLSISANGSFSFPTAITDGNSYSVSVLTQPGSPTQSCSVSNGSGVVSGANVTNVAVSCTTVSIPTYTVGGSVSGLSGSGLVLQNNAGDNLTIYGNGSFSFATPVSDGNAYSVSILSQPGSPNQICSISNASGTISGANVSNVSISCITQTYTVGGSVTGLSGSGLVLQNNNGDDLSISANGNFTFATPVADGSGYAVTVLTPPGSPSQSCSVSNGSGSIAGANVSNVSISCTTNSYTVGGSVTGLSGSGLVLQNNGGDNLSITVNGSFTFSTALLDGSSYSVSVQTQPGSPNQTCSVSNAGGTISGSNVSNISISCTTQTYTVGGSVSGLSGGSLVLQDNGGDNLSISANGSFSFPTALLDGSSYSVAVQSQPGSPAQTCSITNASGTVSCANVTNVAVSCVAAVSTYSLSGTISSAPYTYSDSDINDSYAPSAYHTSNSDPTTAQVIGNPAIVGGYANEFGVGSNGANYASGDYDDFYKVTLNAGDTVTLYTADSANATYWLFLSDPATPNTAEAWSQAGGATQTVTAPTSKTYLVWVYLYTGASNYTLTIGNYSGASVNNQQVTSNNFVPDQLLVTFKSDTSSSPAAKSLKNDIGMAMKAQVGKRAALMDFSAQRDMVMQNLHIKKQIPITRRPYQPMIPGDTDSAAVKQSKQDTLQILRELRKRTDIASVDLNYIRKAKAIPSGNADYANLWSYSMIGMDSVWSGTSITGSGSIVAVIDTGELLNHPDLAGQFVSGYDFISDPTMANDGDGIDADPSDPGDNPGSSSFHGTHVAGTIAAVNNSIGSVGIAYGAKIMPLRALGVGGGTDADIMQAMLFAAGLSNSSGTVPAQKADVINMSLGGSGSSSAFQDVVNQVRAAGVIIIAAAGNNNSSTPSYPAAYDGVVSVSAVGPDKSRAYYSNYGSTIDVAAPGGDQSGGTANGIYSTLGDDSSSSIVYTYGYYQGTSMATPHVAAVAALMKEANPSMTPADFDAYLSSGNITDDLGTAGRDDYYGYGLIDAAKAVTVAGTPIPAYFVVDPSSLTYISNVSTKTITVSNGGTVAFSSPASTSISYSSGSGWLTVTPSSVDSNKLGTYQLDVDRTGLATGEYMATVTFSSSGVTDYVLNVTLRVGLDIGVDAGYHYVILVDADTNTRVASMEVAPSSGQYSYSFSGVPAGNYYIYAGTDMDNDGNFCDTGEACGSYSNSPLAVSADVSGLDFVTQFDTPPTSRSGYAK